METETYIKEAIIKCRARSILYHSKANLWSKIHWSVGIVNSLISGSISLLSFIGERQGWNSNEVGMVGGLVLTVSTGVITSLKAAQRQEENEKAGDAYRNLQEAILSQYLKTKDLDDDQRVDGIKELGETCKVKLTEYTSIYKEPPPKKCIPLENRIRNKKEIFPV